MYEYLYKYRKIGNIDSFEIDENTLKMLRDGELYFSNPKSFNDPFDSKFTYIIDGTNEELIQNMVEKGKTLAWAKKMIETYSRKEIHEKYFKNLNERLDIIRVFCLTETYLSTLMWSHYGQNHYGICIGIHIHDYKNYPNIRIRGDQVLPITKNYDPQYIPICPVKYTNDRPQPINVLRNKKQKMNDFILTKSLDWEYEKEQRIMLPIDRIKKNPVKIVVSQIGEIIFGLRTPFEMIKEIKLLTNNIRGIKYYQIEENQRTFALARKEI